MMLSGPPRFLSYVVQDPIQKYNSHPDWNEAWRAILQYSNILEYVQITIESEPKSMILNIEGCSIGYIFALMALMVT